MIVSVRERRDSASRNFDAALAAVQGTYMSSVLLSQVWAA
jgi:hypothetical protein